MLNYNTTTTQKSAIIRFKKEKGGIYYEKLSYKQSD